MTIIRPNSISGINSITAKNTDQMKLYDSNGAWSHVRAGVITASSFSGPITGTTGNFGGDVTISGDLGVGGTITYEDVARVDATGISTFREGFKLGPLAGIALTAYKDGSIRTSGIVTAASFVGDGANLTGIDATQIVTGNTSVQTVDTGSDGHVKVTTEGSERLRIDSGGRLYTGASQTTLDSTAGTIHIDGGTSGGRIALRGTTTSAHGGLGEIFAYWGSNKVSGIIATAGTDTTNKDDGKLHFYTATGSGVVERLRILSNGDVSIGDIDPSSGATLHLRSPTTHTKLELSTKDNYNGSHQDAYISFTQQNGTEIALIHCDTKTSAANRADLAFYTNFGGLAERMRITEQGRFLVNTTSAASVGGNTYLQTLKTTGNDTWHGLAIEGVKSGYSSIQVAPGADATYYPMYIRQHDDAYCGKISCYTNNTVSYDNASDYRLKQNDVPITDGIAKVKLLRPIRFEMKSDPGNQLEGFFAHEVQAAVPLSCAANGTKDQVDSDNNPVYQGMDYGKITPILTAALKEAIAKIETLETEVAALKSS